jgi:diacylglycerol kinase family enzyme
MAILPLGTVSVLAHEIGLPLNLRKAVALALRGAPRRISLGKITFPTLDDAPSHHFLLMAGIGFDGAVCYGISTGLKRRVGRLAYILSGLRVLVHYDPPPLLIRGSGVALIDQGRRPGDVGRPIQDLPSPQPFALTGYTMVAGKAACYGGPQKITVHAKLDEPALHVFVFHGRSRLALARLAAGIMLNRHLTFSDISYLVAQDLEVSGLAHVQIDGDYAGVTPVRIEVVPDALNLVMAKSLDPLSPGARG